MDADEIKRAAARTSTRIKVGPMLAMLGMMMIVTAFIIGIVVATTAADYYAFDKAARDAAGAGSSILSDLRLVNTWPVWTTPFMFLGVTTMMVGIALMFSTIPGRIQQRASAMALTLPRIIESRQGTN